MRNRIAALCVTLLTLSTLSACTFTAKLEVENQSGRPLIPYPVITNPPPPHREAQPNATIAQGARGIVKPGGFNPIFYTPTITDPTKANALYLGLDLVDADPLMIHWKLMHCKVEPGKEGNDPNLQPIVFDSDFVEVDNINVIVRVSGLLAPGSPPWKWQVNVIQK